MKKHEAEVRENLLHMTDKNIFVLAGAGAGKSTLMINRILQQSKAKKQELKHTAAITFTKKATMELEEKFLSSIMALEDQGTRQVLLQERNDLTIGTIHSFCQKLLQERPLEADLSPNFSVIEEGEAKELFYQVLRDVFYGEFAEEEAYAYMESRKLSLYAYMDMLLSQAFDYELALEEEPVGQLDESSLAAEHDQMLADFKADIAARLIPTNIGIAFHTGVKFRAAAKAYTVKDACQHLFDPEKDTEANLHKLFQEGQVTKIMELAPESQMDLTEFTRFVQGYLWQTFQGKYEPLIEKGKLALNKVLTKKSLENVQQLAPAWLASCQAIIDDEMDTGEKVQQLFDHLYENLVVNEEGNIEELLTKNYQALYKEVYDGSSWELLEFFVNASFVKGKVCPTIKEKQARLKEMLLAHSIEGRMMKGIMQDLFQRTIKRYKAAKKMRNVVTNNDLLRKTFQLLENEDVRLYFQDKYRHLYVDECQDTDPLQTKILFYLTSEVRPTSMKDALPRPGSLFLVGDSKQSIYRFRNADLGLYQSVQKMAEASEDWYVASLHWNYRSNERLIHWFNERFPAFFEEEKDDRIQAVFQAMTYPPTKEKAEGNDESVVYQLPLEDEMDSMINWIHHYTSPGKKGRYEDILLITVNNNSVKRYVDALKDAGIPTTFSGKAPASEFTEIVRLCDLLSLLAEPNKFRKAKVLAQNWYIPLSLFHKYMEADDGEKSQENFASIRLAEEHIDYYRALARQYSPMEFLRTLVYEEGVGIYEPHLSEGEWLASRSILTTFIESVKGENPQTLAHLAKVVRKKAEQSIEYELARDSEENTVKIMNLHKTKGLQAKIVFLLGGESEFKWAETKFVNRDNWNESIEYVLYQKLGLHPRIEYASKNFLANRAIADAHREAERVRKLYVAATRAAEKLIITKNNKKANEWDPLLSEGLPILPIPSIIKANVKKKYIQLPDVTSSGAEEDKAFMSSYYHVTPSDRQHFSQSQAEHVDAELEGEADDGGGNQQNAPFKGAIWGDLVHQGIEWINNYPDADFDETMYREIIRKGLAQHELSDKAMQIFGLPDLQASRLEEREQQLLAHPLVKESLLQVLKRFKENDIFRTWQKDYHAYAELPFTAWLDGNQQEAFILHEELARTNKPVLMNGIIDLVLQSKTDPGQFIIVDYKTNQIRDGEDVTSFRQRLINTYRHQLHTYRGIIGELFYQDARIDSYIYSVTLDEFIKL